jgi:hypothetical protein
VIFVADGAGLRGHHIWMSEPLQFDRADDDVATPSAVRSCASCQNPIVDRYYTLQDKLLCLPCHAKVVAAVDARFASGSFGAALVRGGGAALLGAVIYYGVTAITGYQLGLISVLVGYLVGKGVAQGAKGKGGLGYQALAVGLTYLSIGLTFVPELLRIANEQHHSGVGAALVGGVLVLIGPIIHATQSPLSALINGFALYEAWKLNRALTLPITGPHSVNAPPVHVG